MYRWMQKQFIGRLDFFLELSQRQCCCRKQELWRQKEDDGRLKSTNSSSELNNKGCPLICIKDQTIPLCLYGSSSTAAQAGESGPNGQSVTVVKYDHTGLDLWALYNEKFPC